jgi:hypothetical protein
LNDPNFKSHPGLNPQSSNWGAFATAQPKQLSMPGRQAGKLIAGGGTTGNLVANNLTSRDRLGNAASASANYAKTTPGKIDTGRREMAQWSKGRTPAIAGSAPSVPGAPTSLGTTGRTLAGGALKPKAPKPV